MALSMAQTAGSPYVTLTKTGTDGTFTVTRTVAGVATPVRGNIVVTGGTGTLVDREAPQATAVSYAAGADTASGTTLSVGTWLIHPAQQALDTPVVISEYPTWSRGVRSESVVPLGSRLPVVVSGRRQGREGAITVAVQSLSEQNALEALLNSTRLLLLSTNQYPAGAMWVAAGEEAWRPVSHSTEAIWLVTVPLTEVARPTVTTTGVVTWLDVAQRYSTWNDLAAAYATWDDLIADSVNWTS